MYVSYTVFSLGNYQGVGGGFGLEFTSKNLGHTHCHIKGIWMQKTWGPPTPKGPRENTGINTLHLSFIKTHDNFEVMKISSLLIVPSLNIFCRASPTSSSFRYL